MKYFSNTRGLFAVLFSVFFITSCVTSGSLNTTTYSHNYRTMIDVTEQAIRSSRLNIEQVTENEAETEYEFIFSERVRFGGETVQGNLGRVVITKINEDEARVRIVNPEYHFTVPVDQRKDYQDILSDKIEQLLDDRG